MQSVKRMFSAAILVGLVSGSAAMATGGVVQPASATPFGYSLSALAQDTAVYNTGVFTGNPATPPAPNIPFTVLEGDTTVSQNAYLYLPIFFADNSTPFADALSATFPKDITSQSADQGWLDNYVLQEYHVTQFLVQVDGATPTLLSDDYIAGVNTDPLLDGPYRSTDAGPEYITDAAVLSPLSYGTHTIGFGGLINGNPVIFGSYSVSSVPEPTLTASLTIAGFTLLAKRRKAK